MTKTKPYIDAPGEEHFEDDSDISTGLDLEIDDEAAAHEKRQKAGA